MAKGSIVQELRSWREGMGYTLAQAGKCIVVDGKAVGRAVFHAWETGKKRPSDEFMAELERVTGVTPNAFYNRPDDQSSVSSVQTRAATLSGAQSDMFA